MSSREKRLLILFGAAAFFIVNLIAFRMLGAKKDEVERQRMAAERKLDTAKMVAEQREMVSQEMDWLAQHEPKPAVGLDIQTSLEQLGEREARATGLTIKSKKPLPLDTAEGSHFHRAKFQFSLTGPEDALYRWFDKINVPDQLRIASAIRLTPNAQDDTQIDCVATVEQYFVPLPPST